VHGRPAAHFLIAAGFLAPAANYVLMIRRERESRQTSRASGAHALVVAFLLATTVALCGFADQLGDDDSTPVARARNAQEAAEQLRMLFRRHQAGGPSALVDPPDPSVALHAAWEVHRKAVPRRPPQAHRSTHTLDGRTRRRFLEEVRRRVGVVPGWWADCFRDASLYPDNVTRYRIPEPELRQVTLANGASIIVPGDLRMRPRDGRVLVGSGRISRSIPLDLFAAAVPVDRGIVGGAVTRDRLLLASYGSSDFPFSLCSVDPAANRPLWRADVWGVGPITVAGRVAYRVQVIPEADRVLVYGGHSYGMYVEAFRAVDGASTLRFSTNYWGDRSAVQDRPVYANRGEGD
jgi:hypothetical protein